MLSTVCRRSVNIYMIVILYYRQMCYTFYGFVFQNRFDRLISRNVSVQIESDLHLKSKKESLNWLNYLTNFKVLDAIFMVNQVP